MRPEISHVLVVGLLSSLGIGLGVARAQDHELAVYQERPEAFAGSKPVEKGIFSGTIRGRVSDASSGLPVFGIIVTARLRNSSETVTGFSAGDGTYELTVSSGGDWFVYTRSTSASSQPPLVGQLYPMIECIDPGEVCDYTAGTPITLAGGSVAENIDFPLVRGGTVSGQYLEVTTGYDANDFPEISLFDASGDLYAKPMDITMRYKTSGLREFATSALPAGTYYLAASSPGFVDQVYPDLDCGDLACDATEGDLITVTVSGERTGVDFRVAVDPLQGGAIAGVVGARNVEEALPIGRVSVWDGSLPLFLSASSTRSYVLAGIPQGSSLRVVARDFDYFAELFDNIRCGTASNQNCDPLLGTPVSTTAGAITKDIDFCLQSIAGVLEDGFECGDLSAWSGVTPTP